MDFSFRKYQRHFSRSGLAFSGISRKKALVIGSAHIDIFADYSSKDRNLVDKVGTVNFRIGGTAYNIAVNLAQCGYPVYLLTVLQRGSPISKWIFNHLRKMNVRRKYIHLIDGLRDGAFCAHREDGRLVSAVTSTAIEKVSFNSNVLYRAINRATVIVADCNLGIGQLRAIQKTCVDLKKKLIVAAVSEPKSLRLRNFSVPSFEAVIMNDSEARAITPEFKLTPDFAETFCGMIGTRYAIVTAGSRGYFILGLGRELHSYPAPSVPTIISESGAGDAVAAAIAACIRDKLLLDVKELHNYVSGFVEAVLMSDGSTIDSEVLNHDSSVPRPALSKGAFAVITGGGLTALLAILQLLFDFEDSEIIRPWLQMLFCKFTGSACPL